MSGSNGQKDPGGLTFAGLLEEIRLPERSVTLCLRGDLQAAYEDLQRQIDDLPRDWQQGSLSEVNPRTALEAQREDLRDEMAAHERTFTFRAVPGERYSRMLVEHNTGDDVAVSLVLNEETWPYALIAACLVEPFTVSEDQARELKARLSSRQFQDLYECALQANRESVSVPFSRRPSAATQPTAPN